MVVYSVANSAAGNSPEQVAPLLSGALSGAIERLAQQGLAIDLDRMIAIRNEIADGRYPFDIERVNDQIAGQVISDNQS